MKKILLVILATMLVLLCSCATKREKVPTEDLQSNIVSTTTSVQSGTEGSAVSDETTSGTTDGTDKTDKTDSGDKNVSVMPDKSFIGVWSTDELKTNQILIWDVTPVSVKFNTGVAGLFGFDATAMELNGKMVFGDGISPYYSGPDGVKGSLEFSDNSITVVYDDFGVLEYTEFYATEYTFTLKDENSDTLVEQYKAGLQN